MPVTAAAQHDYREPMVQVRSEPPCLDKLAEVRLRRGDQLDVHGVLRHGTHAPHPFRLNGSEELALQ